MTARATVRRAGLATVLAVGVAAIAGIGLAPAPSTAAVTAATKAPTSLDASQFTLKSDYHSYDALNSALTSALGTASVSSVMDNANHSRGSVTDSAVKNLAGYSTGFTYESGDQTGCTVPQGITTTRDALGGSTGGNYDGHQLVAVSWYSKKGCNGATQARSRITLIDWDATYPNKYRKVLLVEPTGTTAAPSFKDVPIHAGGVSWYGDYLYVADTSHGMRVFDMRKILKTNTGGDANSIGRQSDGSTWYAHNYAYVLPQIGTITSNTTSGTALNWSTVSLDRPGNSLVMAEYTCAATNSACDGKYPERAGRAVRFPFASGATTFAASTTATQALQLPVYGVNGVASHNGRWWFNSSQDKKLYYWTPGATSSTAHTWIGGGESLSYWEDPSSADLLWSLQETGQRSVFAVKQGSYGS